MVMRRVHLTDEDARTTTIRRRTELADVTADIERVVAAICKVGISAALESKLKELEQRQRTLKAEIISAETVVALPDRAAIVTQWRDARRATRFAANAPTERERDRDGEVVAEGLDPGGPGRPDRDGPCRPVSAKVGSGVRFGRCLLTLPRSRR